MVKVLPANQMGHANHGWLDTRHHFSFANYQNPDNIRFGVLRVLNDDFIKPQSGFGTHPHQNMEIVSYIVEGEITHKDSMGNEESLKAGEVQYLSAGDGITHSEYNWHQSKTLRLIQIWILPPKLGLPRLYGSHRYKPEEYKKGWLHIVSHLQGDAPVKIYQDVNFYATQIDKGQKTTFALDTNRQLYFMQVEGSASINGNTLGHGDACEVVDETTLYIEAKTESHFLCIEMPKVN
jgi:redox-sensitive bicupin YhaK (pirin superfamily)